MATSQNPADYTLAPPPPDVSQNPDDYKPVRSAIGEIATGAKRGLYQGIAGAGSVLQGAGEIANVEPGIISRAGKAMEDYGKQKIAEPDMELQPGAHGAVTNFLASQVAPAPGGMLPLLAASAGVGAAGTALGGPVGGIVGAGVGGGSEAYIQTYHEKYQEALAKHPDDVQGARDYAAKSAALQGGIMAGLSAIPGAGPLTSKIVGPIVGKTATEAAQAVIEKRLAPEFGKKAAELAVANVAGGGVGAAGQAAIDQQAGLAKPGETPWEAAKESVGGSLGATLGFLPLSFLHARGNVLQAAQRGKALAEGDAGVDMKAEDRTKYRDNRQSAVDAVAANINRYDKEGAANWYANAKQAIREGKPIGIGPDWMTGPHPDLFADVTGPAQRGLGGPPGSVPPAAGAAGVPPGEPPQPGDTTYEQAAAANARREARYKASGFQPTADGWSAGEQVPAGEAEAAATQREADRRAEEVRRGGLPPDVQMATWGEVLDKNGDPVEQPPQAPAAAPAEAPVGAGEPTATPPGEPQPTATPVAPLEVARPPDPLHAPDAGPISRTAALAVDSGLARDPYAPPEPPPAHPIRPEVTQPPDLQMQDRDRSQPAAIAQTNTIAQHPDYDRLGVGKSPNEAAPLVSVTANHPTIPEEDFGKSSVVVMADGSKMPFRYAVVEAPDVLASHNIDGSVNGDYYSRNLPGGVIRALNNGRVIGIANGYERGTADDYRTAMTADSDSHGVSPEAIADKKAPMLVRVYDDKENARPNIGALSNPQVGLKHSAPEQAQNDARMLDAGSLVVDENGDVAMGGKNEGALKQFLQAIPAAEHNDLVSKSGYTKQFATRVRNALFAKAYGNVDLVNMAIGEHDPEMKNILGALAKAAPEFAQVEHGGQLDIRPSIIEAMNLIRQAKAKGIKPSDMPDHPDLMGRDPMTETLAAFMSENARSAPKMAAAFQSMARFLGHEREASKSVDIFDRKPATMADLARSVNTHLEREYGPETTLRVAEKEPPYGEEPTERAAESGGGTRLAPATDGGERERGAGAAPGPAREPIKEYDEALTKGLGTRLTPEAKVELKRRVALAVKTKPEFQRRVFKIIDSIEGASMYHDQTDIKGPGRAIEKITSEYSDDPRFYGGKGDPTLIKDLVRATIVVRTVDDIQAAIDGIAKEFGTVALTEIDPHTGKLWGKLRNSLSPTNDPEGRLNLKDKHGNPLLYKDTGTPAPDGYRDVLFNVKFGEGKDALKAEIQVNIPELLAIKDKYHVEYAARDEIQRREVLEKRDLTDEEVAQVQKYNALMRSVYVPAWDNLPTTKATKSASEIGGQALYTKEEGKRLGPLGAQATARTPGLPSGIGATETGVPSESKNKVPLGKEAGKKEGLFIGGVGVKKSIPPIDTSIKVDSEHPIIKTLAENRDDMAAFTEHGNMVPIEQLVSTKDESGEPRVLAGTKRDPRLTAAYWMDQAIQGDAKAREPITVSERPDGRYDVIDGNATVQAARLAGWTELPIQFEKTPGIVAEPETPYAGALREQDIPPLYFTKTRVPVEVYIADEDKTETLHMTAKKALADVREEISNYQKLLDCVRGAA